jgi:hypothetical protein
MLSKLILSLAHHENFEKFYFHRILTCMCVHYILYWSIFFGTTDIC